MSDPIFPNKIIVGYDAFGKPVYDMAATGFNMRTWFFNSLSIVGKEYADRLDREINAPKEEGDNAETE